MRQVRFDPSINLGHLLTFIGFILTGIAAYTGARIELSVLDQRLKAVEQNLGKLTDILITSARQETRILAIEKRLDQYDASPRRRLETEARP